MNGRARAAIDRHPATNGRPAYLAAGDRRNPAIVMLHGACMNANMFASQIAAFEDGFRILAIDLPGHGNSAEMDFSMLAMRLGVLNILDHEDITSCHLVGQSMGGLICQLLMQARPDLAASLTLIGSVPLTAPLYRLKPLPFLLVRGMIRFLPRVLIHRLIALAAGTLPETRKYIEANLRMFDRQGLVHIVSEIGRTLKAGPYPAADGNQIPVLMIIGTRDFLALLLIPYLARRWAPRLSASLQEIPRASHNTNMDQPKEVNRQLAAFLGSASGERDETFTISD